MKKVILAVSVLILSACNLGSTIANTTEEVANKTATKAGEIIGGSTRGFADGVGEGLDKAGNSFIKLSEDLSKKGIKLGGHKIETLSGNDNKISIYFIFEEDFTGIITVKYSKRGCPKRIASFDFSKMENYFTNSKSKCRLIRSVFFTRIHTSSPKV